MSVSTKVIFAGAKLLDVMPTVRFLDCRNCFW